LTIKDLVGAFSPKRHAQVLKAIEYLIDEGVIDKVEDKLKKKQ